MAATEIVFPLDDDSMLVDRRTIEQALLGFQARDVGIVAMPFVNKLASDEILQAGPDMSVNKFDFVACAHGVRRSVILDCGGYNEDLFFMGEESDLALRLFDRGWKSAVVACPPIMHLQPPHRRSWKADFFGRRNELIFVFQLVPTRYLVPALIYRMLRGGLFSLRTGRVKSLVRGYLSAFGMIGRVPRGPISASSYRAFRAAGLH